MTSPEHDAPAVPRPGHLPAQPPAPHGPRPRSNPPPNHTPRKPRHRLDQRTYTINSARHKNQADSDGTSQDASDGVDRTETDRTQPQGDGRARPDTHLPHSARPGPIRPPLPPRGAQPWPRRPVTSARKRSQTVTFAGFQVGLERLAATAIFRLLWACRRRARRPAGRSDGWASPSRSGRADIDGARNGLDRGVEQPLRTDVVLLAQLAVQSLAELRRSVRHVNGFAVDQRQEDQPGGSQGERPTP